MSSILSLPTHRSQGADVLSGDHQVVPPDLACALFGLGHVAIEPCCQQRHSGVLRASSRHSLRSNSSRALAWYFDRSCLGKTVAESLLFRSALPQGCSGASYKYGLSETTLQRGLPSLAAQLQGEWTEHGPVARKGGENWRTKLQNVLANSRARGWRTKTTTEVGATRSLQNRRSASPRGNGRWREDTLRIGATGFEPATSASRKKAP
jgi:hypothetical protein